ncbi:unnamed protein product [Macrosiphum euphorbiae]|uniref:YqaJ viral recombinase domain-containing protein n=1 Tax=Macrosiphum euphorbiae TaxID=13131 RepID=A0AAV0Y6B7_9HEMI|nr:unnamed protein product [Macrosiphum euphorbiae]CAI6376455.1 unnamed protein product [Macrosiphum euphorbiae]
MEPVALEYFENNMGTTIQTCGLIIDEDYPFFGASPDGLIGNDSIIEVKCPYSAKDYPTVEEAIKDKKIKFLKLNERGEISLKKDDNYFYQIIGQLRISKRDICHFIVYSHNWQHVEIIKYDPQFWIDKMESKLKRFYYECLLPEIVDPQFGKRFLTSDIIDPNYIITAQKSKTKK